MSRLDASSAAYRSLVLACSAYPAAAGANLWGLCVFHGYLNYAGLTTHEFVRARRARKAAKPAAPTSLFGAEAVGCSPLASYDALSPVDVDGVELRGGPSVAVPDAREAFETPAKARDVLRHVLATRALAELLRAHLEARAAADVLDFLDAVADFRARPSEAAARRVHDAYVAPGAAAPVDVAGKAQRALKKRLDAGDGADAALFDAAVDSAVSNAARSLLKTFLAAHEGAVVDGGDEGVLVAVSATVSLARARPAVL